VAVQQVKDLSREKVRKWLFDVLEVALPEMRRCLRAVLSETGTLNPAELSCRGLESAMKLVRWSARFSMMRSSVVSVAEWDANVYDQELDNILQLKACGEGADERLNSREVFLEATRIRHFLGKDEDELDLVVIH